MCVSQSPASAARCADVAFIGARGSGQTVKDAGGYGPQVEALRSRLVSFLEPIQLSVESTALAYPSEPVEVLGDDLLRLGGAFFNGIDHGVVTLNSHVRRSIEGCRGQQRIVLAGYSQGAMVVHLALNKLSLSERSHIAAVVLLSDPLRLGGSPVNVGTASANFDGVAHVGSREADIPSDMTNRTWSFCYAGDIVCDSNLFNISTVLPGSAVEVHTSKYQTTPARDGSDAILRVLVPNCGGRRATVARFVFRSDPLAGTSSADVIVGSPGSDTIEAGSGDDRVCGREGDDDIRGGSGDDDVWGGEGNDSIDGGSGDDRIWGLSGMDAINGGAGQDAVWGGAGPDLLFGGQHDDHVEGNDGDDVIYGGTGADSLRGGAGSDHIYGGAGDDTLRGGTGPDSLFGDDGRDSISGQAGNDECEYEGGRATTCEHTARNETIARNTIHKAWTTAFRTERDLALRRECGDDAAQQPCDAEGLRLAVIDAVSRDDDVRLAVITTSNSYMALNVRGSQQMVANQTVCVPQDFVATCGLGFSDEHLLATLTMTRTTTGWVVSNVEWTSTH